MKPFILRMEWSIILILFLGITAQCDATGIACSDDSFCEYYLQLGSQCLDGFCSNPFYQGGCIKSYLPDWHKIRICNSDDPKGAAEQGVCRESPFNYMEIRALAQDWESSIFATWILQIFLVSDSSNLLLWNDNY